MPDLLSNDRNLTRPRTISLKRERRIRRCQKGVKEPQVLQAKPLRADSLW